MKQHLIALTGGIGSGKSTISRHFSSFGVPVIDSDMIAKSILEKNKSVLLAIIRYFGLSVLDKDGSINRAILRKRIFNNPFERLWINNLLHPIIQKIIKKKLDQVLHCYPYVLWVSPLLIEKGLQKQVKRILVVDTSRESQVKRTMIRDNVTKEQVEGILESQISRLARLSYADDTINNDGNSKETINQISALHYKYLSINKSNLSNIYLKN